MVAGVLVLVLAAAPLAGCGDDEPADGYQVIAAGDFYGEYELSAEFEDGAWTGCMRMDYDEDGPMCDDPDQPLVVFEDPTGATYGAVAEGETAELVDDGEALELIDGRFFLVLEGPDVRLAE